MSEATAPAAGEPKVGELKNDLGQPITASWRDTLAEPYRKATTLDKFVGKDWTEVGPKIAQSYIELEKMPRGVDVPKDGDPKEKWDAFFTKLGRPATADEYAVDIKVPEGTPWNKEAEKMALAKMHARGLTRTQAKGVLEDYLALAHEGNIHVAQEKARTTEQALAEITEEWGGLTEANLAVVNRLTREFGGDEFATYLEETGLGNDPRYLRFALKMGQPMIEKNMIRGEGLGMKRVDAQAKIEALMKDPLWAKGDKGILKQIEELYPLAHGE